MQIGFHPALGRSMMEANLPPSAMCLAPLVGNWVGDGQGLWPADPVFRYREEISFRATGKSFLTYEQRTYALDDGRGLHVETGYLRAVGGEQVEFLIVQPTGFIEIHAGTLTPRALTLQLVNISPSPTALAVTDLRRHFILEPQSLTYVLQLAMNREPLADHLRGRLHRTTHQ